MRPIRSWIYCFLLLSCAVGARCIAQSSQQALCDQGAESALKYCLAHGLPCVGAHCGNVKPSPSSAALCVRSYDFTIANVCTPHVNSTPAASNSGPQARDLSAYWVDQSGYFWIFGGLVGGFLSNDLWAGNAGIGPSAAMVWTQVTAPSSSPKTTSSSPGARSMSAFSGDSMGRLWLFGGYGFDTATNIGDLNDLWVYTPGARGSAGQWISASISGSNLVNQSSTGLTPGSCAKNSVNAYPSARYAAVSWMDNNGHFWLFGGNGYGSPGVTNQVPWADSFGYMNDLWEYVPPATGVANGTWTCLTGDTQAFDPLHPSALNGSPPPRDGASGWTDSNGNLWLFGGTGLNGALNDLWMYSPSSGTWTSVSAGASGSPPPRWGAASWTDSKHDFWLSGGATGGAPFSYSAPTGVFNDYWEYKPAAGTWTLIGGSASAVPTSGVTSPATAPGARYGASAWPSSAFPEFWLFGGWGYSPSQPFPTYLNDTWNVTGVVY